jgi:Mn-dependent DtxR family transcriptional regulator
VGTPNTPADYQMAALRRLERGQAIASHQLAGQHRLHVAKSWRAAVLRLLLDNYIERIGRGEYRLTAKGRARLATDDARRSEA